MAANASRGAREGGAALLSLMEAAAAAKRGLAAVAAAALPAAAAHPPAVVAALDALGRAALARDAAAVAAAALAAMAARDVDVTAAEFGPEVAPAVARALAVVPAAAPPLLRAAPPGASRALERWPRATWTSHETHAHNRVCLCARYSRYSRFSRFSRYSRYSRYSRGASPPSSRAAAPGRCCSTIARAHAADPSPMSDSARATSTADTWHTRFMCVCGMPLAPRQDTAARTHAAPCPAHT